MAKRRPAAEQIEVLLNAFGLAKRAIRLERPVVARHEVVFIAAEPPGRLTGRLPQPAGLVVDRREPAGAGENPGSFSSERRNSSTACGSFQCFIA